MLIANHVGNACTFLSFSTSTITEGKGTRVVALIKEISTNFRNISQDPVLYCLALCARTDDNSTKEEAYRILNEVCRIPTHLFQVTSLLLNP